MSSLPGNTEPGHPRDGLPLPSRPETSSFSSGAPVPCSSLHQARLQHAATPRQSPAPDLLSSLLSQVLTGRTAQGPAGFIQACALDHAAPPSSKADSFKTSSNATSFGVFPQHFWEYSRGSACRPSRAHHAHYQWARQQLGLVTRVSDLTPQSY